ncbi:MAG TPA: FtsX-like permease family protein [Treponemataceae bacterium]|jgi:ABC-type lipoprotein release transport system permease subunit|nr:FtsX-like permease family protein [Treponemataceae bacterium]
MIFSIAWKNMFRYKRRTLITASAIALGIMFSIMMEGMLFGADQDSKRNLIWYETSAAKIYAASYFEQKETFPVQYFIDKEQRSVLDDFLKKKNIKFAPRFQTYCDIYFSEEFFETAGSISGILSAVDVTKDSTVYKVSEEVERGSWLGDSKDASRDENGISTGAVIGSWLAKDMKAELGWYITIQCKGRGGFIQTMDIPIIGIIQSSNPIINASGVFMDLAFVNEMLELKGGVTEYSLSFGDISVSDKRYETFRTEFKSSLFSSADSPLELYSWRDIEADFLALTKTKSASSKFFLVFMLIIAAVGISNTMLMAVMERKHEIGMLKTLGYTNKFIRSLFMLEGLCIGIIGSIAGLLLGFAVNFFMVQYGINFGSLLEGVDIGYRISAVMRSGWNIPVFFLIAFGALIVSALSAFIPSGKMVRVEIAEIFREV